jgi:hypothetical protein
MWSPGRGAQWWSRQHTAHCLSMASRSPCESLGTLVMSRWTVHDTLHAPVRWVCRQFTCSVVAMGSRQGTAQCPSTARRSSCEALGTLVMSRWTVHDTLHAPVRWVCRQSRCSVVAMGSRQGTAQCPSMARRSSCEALGTLVMSRWTVHDMCPCGGCVVSSRALWSRWGRDRAPLSDSARRGDRHARHWAHWLCSDGLWTTCARVVGVSSVQALCGRGVVATGTAQCVHMASRSPCEALGTLVMSRWTVHDMCPCGGCVVSSRALWSRSGRDMRH